MLRKILRIASIGAFLWPAILMAAGVEGFNYDYFGKYEEGTRRYMYLVEQAHLDSSHLNKPVMQLIKEASYVHAFGELKYVLDRIPNHPRALQIVSFLSRLTKKQSVAVGYFEKALGLYPQYAITHAQYGSFLMDIGTLDGGIEQVKQAIELDPKLAAGYALLSRAYLKKGDNNLAQEFEQKARELGYQGAISEKTGTK
jgi:tetratricopeptide (TPR) repeat protein